MTEKPSSPDEISKTQLKKHAEQLQKMGIRLTRLSPEQRAKFTLSPELEQALIQYNKITSNGAKRRQSQLIGKLMRNCDYESFTEIFSHLEAEQSSRTASFHLAEQWRERLLEKPDSLTEFIVEFAPSDIQKLRQLIKKAQRDRELDKNSGAARELFRAIKGYIE